MPTIRSARSNQREYAVGQIRSLDDVNAVRSLQAEIWGAAYLATPSTLLWVMSQAGGVVLLATAQSRPVGFAYGLVGRTAGGLAYHRSHAAGVLPEFRNSGIGQALKQAQRQAVLAAGLDRIVWTFDPSQVANAHFNLRRLGAVARVFRSDYYGQGELALSHGLPTDRLLVEWLLGEAEQAELARIRRRSDLVSVVVPEGLPAPPDGDRTRARALQAGLRQDLEIALAQGLQVVDFDAEARSYRLASLPSWFPTPAEPGSSPPS